MTRLLLSGLSACFAVALVFLDASADPAEPPDEAWEVTAREPAPAKGVLAIPDPGPYRTGDSIRVRWTHFPADGHSTGAAAGQSGFHSHFHPGGSQQVRAWLETVDGPVLYANGPIITVTQAPSSP